MQVYDTRVCALGEGPLWHPKRHALFWFDILGKRLLTKGKSWDFDEYVSAAGWLDEDHLLVASETALFRFSLETSAQETVVELEADNPITRSNDGRADPYGGFWIGTMGKSAEPEMGAIYRYYRGELQQIFAKITVSNAISFSPDGLWAYFSDTVTGCIQRVRLDQKDGWPKDAPETFLDLTGDGLFPDGAVVDAQGRLWNAQWGAGRVACYRDGALDQLVHVDAPQTTCPAFGGPDLKTLYITSAAHGAETAHSGMTFQVALDVAGQAEHQVIL